MQIMLKQCIRSFAIQTSGVAVAFTVFILYGFSKYFK